ncbi:DUF4404 family protein [Schlesneria paludicola]|uniref:DUF4404 family protein n=1 Tax=Schlesneria paludicola TaxID=360056 RepID=UPI00029AF651|nr:DUF4404 family protein [Schlesneria paludicola]
MTVQSTAEMTFEAQTHANLRQLAASLREASHLTPDAQTALASLLDEIGRELGTTGLSSEKTARLAEAVSDVARALDEQQSVESFDSARTRLKEAAITAETEAPIATGLAYRFMDTLASIGI